MKLSEFRTHCKVKIPSLKSTGIDDDALDLLINEGVTQVNLLAKAYRGYTNFNIVANQQVYNLSTIAATFQQMSTAGIWIKPSSTGELVRVIPKTEEWLNKKYPSWRSSTAAAQAQYYFHEGDEIYLVPKINQTIALGGRIHHTKIPTVMANGNHYPFTGNVTQITALLPLDNCIIEYVRGQVAPTLNKETGEDLSVRRLEQMVARAKLQVKSKRDVANYYDTAMSVST